MWRTYKKPFKDHESKKCFYRQYYLKYLHADKSPKEAGNSNIVSSARTIKTINISDMTWVFHSFIHHHLMFCQMLMFFGNYSNSYIWLAHSNFLHYIFMLTKRQENIVMFFDVSALIFRQPTSIFFVCFS